MDLDEENVLKSKLEAGESLGKKKNKAKEKEKEEGPSKKGWLKMEGKVHFEKIFWPFDLLILALLGLKGASSHSPPPRLEPRVARRRSQYSWRS